MLQTILASTNNGTTIQQVHTNIATLLNVYLRLINSTRLLPVPSTSQWIWNRLVPFLLIGTKTQTGNTVPTFKMAPETFSTTGTRLEAKAHHHGAKIFIGNGALFSQCWHRCLISHWHRCPLRHVLAPVPNFTLAPWHHGATAFFGTLVPQVVPTPTHDSATKH